MPISADLISSLARTGQRPETSTSAEVFRDFEAMLLAQVLKGSGKPIGGSHSLDGGSAGKLYRELFSEELANKMAESGGIGIAKHLARQAQEQDDGSEKQGE